MKNPFKNTQNFDRTFNRRIALFKCAFTWRCLGDLYARTESKSMVAGNCQWVDGVATLLVCGGDRVNVSYLSCSSVLRSTVGIGDSGISHR